MSQATLDLSNALGDAREDIQLLLNNKNTLLPSYIHQDLSLENVWTGIKGKIGELKNRLDNAMDTLDATLASYGLTGQELKLKLSAYQSSRTRARTLLSTITDAPRVIRRAFKSLLGYLNVWLGSLVAALGAGHAVKEFKEYLEQGVEDAEFFV